MGTPGENTRFYMGDPDPDPGFIGPPVPDWPPKTVGIPGLEPGECPDEDFEFSYFLETDSDAGFNVGGSWWQSVGGSLFLNVVEDARIQYGGTLTLLVGRTSNEFYSSTRNTTIAAGRTDKVKAGGMGQEINGGYFQKISPAGKQEVTGDWTHQVDGENRGKYGAWTNDVAKSWTAKVGGAVMIDAKGTITLSTPSEIKLNAPLVTIQGAKVDAKSPSFFETYGSKRLIGAHKADYVFAYYQCGYTLKAETTGVSLGGFGNKSDRIASKTDLIGVGIKTASALVDKSGIKKVVAGLLSLG